MKKHRKDDYQEFPGGIRKWAYWTAWTIGSILFAICATALFFFLKPYDNVQPGTVEIIDPEGDGIYPGDTVILRTRNFCNSGVSVQVDREIFNSIGGTELNRLFFNAPPAPVCFEESDAPFPVPLEVGAGEWQVRVITSYSPNSIRSNIREVKETPPFTISERPANAVRN